MRGCSPLFDLVLDHVPEASAETGPFRMLGTILEANPFLGRIITGGRITAGTVKPNQTIKVIGQDGKTIEQGRVSKILAFRGIERQPIELGEPGDIVSIAGLTKGDRGRYVLRSLGRAGDPRPADRPAHRHHVLHRQ